MKLDKNGLKQMEEEIELREAKRKKLKAKVGEEAQYANTENSSYEDARLQLASLDRQISDLRKTFDKVELVKPHGQKDRVDIGDTVTVYNELFDDRFDVKLTANYQVNLNSDVEEASINSPIGQALFGKQKGDRVTYKVDGAGQNSFTVVVEQIEKSKTLSLC